MKIVTTLAALLYVLLITSCCCLTKATDGKFTQRNSGAIFNSSRGGIIEIALKGNPTTGYTWNIVEYDSKILKLEGSTFVRDSDLTGAGGVETFKFSVIGKGKTDLVIQYNRVWEKDMNPLELFKLSINSN